MKFVAPFGFLDDGPNPDDLPQDKHGCHTCALFNLVDVYGENITFFERLFI